MSYFKSVLHFKIKRIQIRIKALFMLEESISGHYLNDLGKRLENELYFVRFKQAGR